MPNHGPHVSRDKAGHGGLYLRRRSIFPRWLESGVGQLDQRTTPIEGTCFSPIKKLFFRNRSPGFNIDDAAHRETKLLQGS